MKSKLGKWDTSPEIFTLTVKPDELIAQVNGYKTLGLKSWRKQFAAILAFFAVSSFVFGGFNSQLILVSIAFLILALFSALGYKTAIVLGSVFALVGFALNIFASYKAGSLGFPIFPILVSFLLLETGWKAIKVEIERKKM